MRRYRIWRNEDNGYKGPMSTKLYLKSWKERRGEQNNGVTLSFQAFQHGIGITGAQWTRNFYDFQKAAVLGLVQREPVSGCRCIDEISAQSMTLAFASPKRLAHVLSCVIAEQNPSTRNSMSIQSLCESVRFISSCPHQMCQPVLTFSDENNLSEGVPYEH